MNSWKTLTEKLLEFRDQRNWEQFHTARDLALALMIEAAELNELFLWKTPQQTDQIDKEAIADELADVLAYALLLANKFQLDIDEIVTRKIEKNALRYPVEKSRNSATKYDKLQ